MAATTGVVPVSMTFINFMPSINPDGQLMVVDWYNEWLGTEYEGGRMPWLCHHYIGHDNNRDFMLVSQKESEAVARILYREWFPQIVYNHHQSGPAGAVLRRSSGMEP